MAEFVDTVDFTSVPVANFVLEQSAPAAPVAGSKYFAPADGHEYVYTGSAWVATGQVLNSGPITSTVNNDGTFTINVATASATAAGLLSAPSAALLGTAGSSASGSLVMYSANGGITATVTGNVIGTASNATTLNGQTSAYFLNPANLVGGVAPVSAGGTGLGTAPAIGQILIGDGVGFDLGTISAGPGLYVVNGAGTISIGLSGGSSAPIGASYVVIGGNTALLPNERTLAGAASQITLVDGGANGTATIGLSAVSVAGVQQPKVTIDTFGRVLSSTALVSGDIPALNKTKIADFVESAYVHTTGDETVAGNKTFSNNLTVNGNLFVSGTTTTVSSQQLRVADNLITVNFGETGPGVTNISAGIEVARGTAVGGNYFFAFFENSDTFRIGQSGSMQAVATRVDSMVSGALVAWDATASRLVDVPGITTATILTSASSLAGGKLVAGSVPNAALTNSTITVGVGAGLAGGGSVALGGTTTVSLAVTGTAGTYTKVTTNGYGQVTSGTTLVAADIPNLDWTKITTGKPTTLGGYGITDAVSANGTQTIGGNKNFSLTPTVSGSFTVYHTGNFTPTTGTVTSVALTAPSFLSVAGSPITNSGTLALTLATQTSGAVFAGPATGAAAAPTFRSLVATDIPALDFSKITTGIVPVAQGGTGASSVSGARIALSAAAVANAAIVGSSSTDTYNITNPFNNSDVLVQVIRTTGAVGRVVIPTVTVTAATITVKFGSNVPTGTNYRVTMIGVGA
jgi:hypothetical protein